MSTNEKSNTEKMQEKFADKEMSKEQLENVSGGNYVELADDSEFLHNLLRGKPGQCKRYTHSDFDDEGFFRSMRNRPIIDEIAAAWAAVGIRFEGKVDLDTYNRYFNMETGAEMNRNDAVRHAEILFTASNGHFHGVRGITERDGGSKARQTDTAQRKQEGRSPEDKQ